MPQEIKEPVISKSQYEFESFDIGNRALLLRDAEPKVVKAIDTLGLQGQKELMQQQDGKVIPFPKMNAMEQEVWNIYCPQHDKLEEFSASMIPHEVLSLLSVVKKKGYFDIKVEPENERKGATKSRGWIEVWSEAREDVDPLIVGVIENSEKRNGYWFDEKSYYLVLIS